MISVNYQLYGKGFQLRLRLYQDGETRYVNVNRLLKGDLLRKHWNVKKKRFHPSAPNSEENNAVLEQFKAKYEEAARNWSGTLGGFLVSFDGDGQQSDNKEKTLLWCIQFFIDDMKRNNINEDGTISGGYEPYEKTIKRFEEFCFDKKMDWSRLTLTDITPQFVNCFFDWIRGRGRGRCVYVSNTLKAVLRKSERMGWFDFHPLVNCNWIKKEGKSSKKYQTLTNEQCAQFIGFKKSQLPAGPLSELYRDFCVFILYTCQSVCDAVSLQYKDIQTINGVDHFVFKRRKIASKQSVDCSVPINSEMKRIMKRWKRQAKDGYIFPIRSKERMAASRINNGDIKHFISGLNIWLKKMGDMLGCSFGLHSYVFRHTGITHYISKGVPIIYVANLAGTSVSNCESIYYNNQGDTASRDKVLGALEF